MEQSFFCRPLCSRIRGVFFVSLLISAVSSCGNGSYAPSGTSLAGKKAAEAPVSKDASHPTAKLNAPQDLEKKKEDIAQHRRERFNGIFPFVDNLHRAHFRSGGLLIDLGTQARFGNTLGDWQTGWRGNFRSEEATYSYAQETAARLYFDVDASEAGPAKIVLRARSLTGSKVGVYVDGKPLGNVEFPEDRFGHASVEVASGLEAGMHELMLRSKVRRRAHDGKPACLAVDYVRVTPKEQGEGQASASYETLLLPDAKGGEPEIALVAGESVSFHVPIGEKVSLQGRHRSRTENAAAFEVALAVDGKEPEIVYQASALGQSGGNFGVDLSEWAGQTASLTLRATSGEAIFSETGLYVPKMEPAKASKTSAGRAKNAVLVLIDTLRADKLTSYNKGTRVQTPYLDRLAGESIVFTRALAPENWTKPSVASLLSGLYPTTHAAKDGKDKLPESVTMVSEHFGELGFVTAGFVANGYVSDKFGFKQGWDKWTNYVREGKRNRAQYVFEEAMAWLDARPKDKPFFLYIHTIDPHVPYIPPRKYLTMYDPQPYNGRVQSTKTAALLGDFKTGRVTFDDRDRFRLEALYDGEISYHDDQFARLHEKLAELGLLEDTAIAVTSDHGEEFFDHDSVGHGHSLYEELLHVPLIVRPPGSAATQPGRWDGEVSLVDVFPTLCELMGHEPPEGIEGRSLVPAIEGKARVEAPGASFSEFLTGQVGVRFGRYKAIYKGLSPELYDLVEDPEETDNLADKRPIALAAARDLLGGHLGRFVETEPIGGDVSSSPPKVPAKRHKAKKTNIDPETRKQLKALGYIDE